MPNLQRSTRDRMPVKDSNNSTFAITNAIILFGARICYTPPPPAQRHTLDTLSLAKGEIDVLE